MWHHEMHMIVHQQRSKKQTKLSLNCANIFAMQQHVVQLSPNLGWEKFCLCQVAKIYEGKIISSQFQLATAS